MKRRLGQPIRRQYLKKRYYIYKEIDERLNGTNSEGSSIPTFYFNVKTVKW
jgi:hypothetical protein